MWTIAGYTALASVSAQCNTVAMTLEQLILQRYFICGLASTGRMHFVLAQWWLLRCAVWILMFYITFERAHGTDIDAMLIPEAALMLPFPPDYRVMASIMLVVCECSLRSCNAFPLAHRKVLNATWMAAVKTLFKTPETHRYCLVNGL